MVLPPKVFVPDAVFVFMSSVAVKVSVFPSVLPSTVSFDFGLFSLPPTSPGAAVYMPAETVVAFAIASYPSEGSSHPDISSKPYMFPSLS